MPRELDDVEKQLRRLLPEASGHAARAIQFLLANRDDVPVRSMRELAKRAEVAPVNLVRIAQRLGFEGFDELRAVYVEALMSRAGRNRRQASRLMSLAQMEGSLGFAAKFVEGEMEIQRQTLAGLSEKQLDAAVADLVAARRVFVAGRRPLFAAAFSFAYSLKKVKPGTQLLDGYGGFGAELEGLGEQDLFVGFSFHPYSRITAALAEAARAQKARIIAVTDSAGSPLGRVADHVFLTLVRSYAFPDSTTGAQAIGSLLIGLAVSKMGRQALRRIAANEAQMKKSGELMA